MGDMLSKWASRSVGTSKSETRKVDMNKRRIQTSGYVLSEVILAIGALAFFGGVLYVICHFIHKWW